MNCLKSIVWVKGHTIGPDIMSLDLMFLRANFIKSLIWTFFPNTLQQPVFPLLLEDSPCQGDSTKILRSFMGQSVQELSEKYFYSQAVGLIYEFLPDNCCFLSCFPNNCCFSQIEKSACRPPPDLRTGHIGSRLRSPSGRVK